MTLILDTGVLFASLDRRDERHGVCSRLIVDATEPRLIPATVLVELDHFIRQRLHKAAHDTFLRDITSGAYAVEALLADDYLRIRDLCVKYADMDLGLVDASIVAIAERLNEPKIATLDHRHFRAIRPRHVEAFELVPN